MSRLFGIAGVQMSVLPWDAAATVQKMEEVAAQIEKNFPWIQMIVFHELVASGVAQFVDAPSKKQRPKIAEAIPGPLSSRLCELARRTKKWIVPGSMYETDGSVIYNTSLAISPEGLIVAKYRSPRSSGRWRGWVPRSFCIPR